MSQPTNLLQRYDNGAGSQLDSGTTETSAGPNAPLRGAGIIPTNNTFHDGTYNEFPEAASVELLVKSRTSDTSPEITS